MKASLELPSQASSVFMHIMSTADDDESPVTQKKIVKVDVQFYQLEVEELIYTQAADTVS